MTYRIFLFCFFVLGTVTVFAQSNSDTVNFSVTYYPNGKVLSEGYLRDGKPDGYWKTYYTTGILKSEGNRKNFLIDSVWIFYNSVGDTLQKVNYVLGKKSGYLYEFYTDRTKPESVGSIKCKELYVNNVKEGLSVYYREDGTVQETVNFLNGKKEGISIEYESDGRIISILKYTKGSITERERLNRYNEKKEKEGIWKDFYEGVKVRTESNYRNGLLDGYYKEYDFNGKLLITLLYRQGILVQDVETNGDHLTVKEVKDDQGNIVETGSFVGNIPVGMHTYFEEGKIIEVKIFNDNGDIVSVGLVNEDGQREGRWKNYYISGRVKEEGTYSNNLKEGKWVYYFENGKTEQTGNYNKGKENGEWIWYYNNGSIWREEMFYNGKNEGKFIEYDTLGNVLTEGEYFDGEMEGNWTIKIKDFVSTGNYIGGLRDGKWKNFYDDGTLMFEGDYIQGNPEGKHKYYYPDGSIKEEQYFSGGIPNKLWKKYDEEGNVIVAITYQAGKEYRINGQKIDLDGGNILIH